MSAVTAASARQSVPDMANYLGVSLASLREGFRVMEVGRSDSRGRCQNPRCRHCHARATLSGDSRGWLVGRI